MTDAGHYDVSLVMGWSAPGSGKELRRNTAGFSAIKERVAKSNDGNPLEINAFLYAFLVSAKNLDLFLRVNSESIKEDLKQIREKMAALECLEREGSNPNNDLLLSTYKSIRPVAARPSARDEQRTLAMLLFSGPSTAEQIKEDLDIDKNLAERILRALSVLVVQTEEDPNIFVLRSDTNSLAVTLYLLQYTLGIDPLRVLQSQTTFSTTEE